MNNNKAILSILIITFLGSYGTFKALKAFSNMSLYDLKYYEIFAPYSKVNYYPDDSMEALIQEIVISEKTQDIRDARKIVLLGSAFACIISVFLVYHRYKNEKRSKQKTKDIIDSSKLMKIS